MKYTNSHVVIPGLTGNLLSIWKVLPLVAVVVLLAACGDDPKVGGTEEDAGIIAIENKTVSGVSQKGPFVNGSSVKLYEMDGETLAPTGKSFPGKIASDDGRFTVPSISLASQYALLEANGYFRNEITGDKSNGTITLNALTDLSGREKVNINLLTHLEYERALYLVRTGVKVSEAKKQAESEILDAFEIKGEFENSEDLDIFSSGDGNAALLAFSVLMLGNLTEADLTERLTNFATDVEQDGKWDDEKTKAIIADWASGMSLADGLAGIRNNIAGWNFSNEVPAFEKYVDNFWWQNYGLGTCDKEREGEVLQNTNTRSARYGEDFICRNNIWWDNPIERYGLAFGSDAAAKTRELTKENYLNPKFIAKYGSMIDSRDQKSYKTICIGKQEWLAENLNYADSVKTPSLIGKSWCYGNYANNCDVAGRLYSWTAAMDSVKTNTSCAPGSSCSVVSAGSPTLVQGICPDGWHLPSIDEWNSLITTVGGEETAGKVLKSIKGWSKFGIENTDAFGFSALPAGYYDYGYFGRGGFSALFWSSTEYDSDGAYSMNLYSNYDGATLFNGDKNFAFSVRCLRD